MSWWRNVVELLESTYPAYLESDVVLRNGHTLRLRPVRHEDREHLSRLYARLSRKALQTRFFSARTPEAAVDSSAADVDYRHEFGIIGERAGENRGSGALLHRSDTLPAAGAPPSKWSSGEAVMVLPKMKGLW